MKRSLWLLLILGLLPLPLYSLTVETTQSTYTIEAAKLKLQAEHYFTNGDGVLTLIDPFIMVDSVKYRLLDKNTSDSYEGACNLLGMKARVDMIQEYMDDIKDVPFGPVFQLRMDGSLLGLYKTDEEVADVKIHALRDRMTVIHSLPCIASEVTE